MKNIFVGIILGLGLALCINANAYDSSYTDYQNEVIVLLEDIKDNGDEAISKMSTIVDAISGLPQG